MDLFSLPSSSPDLFSLLSPFYSFFLSPFIILIVQSDFPLPFPLTSPLCHPSIHLLLHPSIPPSLRVCVKVSQTISSPEKRDLCLTDVLSRLDATTGITHTQKHTLYEH